MPAIIDKIQPAFGYPGAVFVVACRRRSGLFRRRVHRCAARPHTGALEKGGASGRNCAMWLTDEPIRPAVWESETAPSLTRSGGRASCKVTIRFNPGHFWEIEQDYSDMARQMP